jgi:hypothetical protein
MKRVFSILMLVVSIKFLPFGKATGSLDGHSYDKIQRSLEFGCYNIDTISPKSTLEEKSPTRILVRYSLNPLKDTAGVYPYTLGGLKLPISNLGATYIGFLGSDESQGFHLRLDNPYKELTKYKRNGKKLVRTKSLGWELGFYSSAVLHTNIYLLATNQWKFKRIKKSQKPGKLQYAFITGAGYSRTFLSDPVYRLKEGEFKRVPMAGYNYLALNAGLTVEYRLKHDATVYLGYNALLLTPYNRLVYPRNQIQMGISFPTQFLFSSKHRPK